MARGKRESPWLVIRRCLAIVRRAQRGPAGRGELIKAVLAQEGSEAYGGTEGQLLRKRFEEDLRRIRQELLIELYHSRQEGGYAIRDTWLPLLDLPDEDLATIGWLEETFGLESPQHDEVHALLGRLRLYLGVERQGMIEQSRTALELDLSRRDEEKMAPGVQEGLTKALWQHRQVELLYLSPQYEDGRPRRHVVDPQERYFDTTRGHYYLRAYCRRCEGSHGEEAPHCFITYRIDRIVGLEVLPQKLSPVPPARPRYEVIYVLAPEVARTGVSRPRWIEVETTAKREDGSAVVRGETSNLFWAVQSLLHYGANCRVIGGPKMVREMERVVGEMAAVYGLADREA